MSTLSEIQKGITELPGFVRSYGMAGGLKRWGGICYTRATRSVSGRSIFDAEWDLCIILDACRADELQRFQSHPEYGWLGSVDRYPSLASCTWNWLPRTLAATPDEELAETTYVCANPFSERFCAPDQFDRLDEVWRDAWDDDLGTVPPRPVTDRAIAHGRERGLESSGRLLIHYLQPHVPFLADGAATLGRSNFDHDHDSTPDAWDRVTAGTLDRDRAVAMYQETLRKVLDEVSLLLSNLDAERAVVTADHGEAFGERGLYGHPNKIDLPCLTQVPWVETRATDERTYTPDVDTSQNRDDDSERETSVSERLHALGYLDMDPGAAAEREDQP